MSSVAGNKKIAKDFFGLWDNEYFEKIQNADDKDAEIAKLLREHRMKFLGLNTILHTPRGDMNFEENTTGQIALCTAIPDLAYKKHLHNNTGCPKCGVNLRARNKLKTSIATIWLS